MPLHSRTLSQPAPTRTVQRALSLPPPSGLRESARDHIGAVAPHLLTAKWSIRQIRVGLPNGGSWLL
jgi:hypothetical protein